MKLQIDTKAKTVKIDELTNIKELIKVLKKMLPDWGEYSIMSDSTWTYYPMYPYYPTYDYNKWIVTCGTNTGDEFNQPIITDTVYNVEVQN